MPQGLTETEGRIWIAVFAACVGAPHERKTSEGRIYAYARDRADLAIRSLRAQAERTL